MIFYYAQINSDNICVGISKLSGEVNADNMLKIQTYDLTLLGSKYVNGAWIKLPTPLPKPTEEELSQAEIFLNQARMQEQLNSIDVVNAQILLKITGGN